MNPGQGTQGRVVRAAEVAAAGPDARRGARVVANGAERAAPRASRVAGPRRVRGTRGSCAGTRQRWVGPGWVALRARGVRARARSRLCRVRLVCVAAADSGASKTFPIQAGELKKGSFVVIKDRPCKVVETSTSKTGKHGHAKVNITALDIFNGRKYEDMCPSSHNVEAPFISRKEFTLTDINKDDGNLAVLMDEEGNLRVRLRATDVLARVLALVLVRTAPTPRLPPSRLPLPARAGGPPRGHRGPGPQGDLGRVQQGRRGGQVLRAHGRRARRDGHREDHPQELRVKNRIAPSPLAKVEPAPPAGRPTHRGCVLLGDGPIRRLPHATSFPAPLRPSRTRPAAAAAKRPVLADRSRQ